MTGLYSPLLAPAPLKPSSVSYFFRPGPASSGRDSPRTMVAEEMFKLHISTPPVQQQDEMKSFTLDTPRGKMNKRRGHPASDQDPLFAIAPTRRSPRRLSPTLLSPLEEMDITDDPPSPTPESSRVHSPPPPDVDSDDEMDQANPADERTRYLRRKKRMEQVAAYRMRELKDDREGRAARRNSLLSPKRERITKPSLKRVKFVV
jgi:hypothetical protein